MKASELLGAIAASPLKAVGWLVSKVTGMSDEMDLDLFTLVTTSKPLPPNAKLLEPVPRILPNGVKAWVAIIPEEGKGLYYVEEPTLSEEELRAYKTLIARLQYVTKLEPRMGVEAYTPEALEAYIVEKAREVSEEFEVAGIYGLTKDKLVYYVKRDLLGYGPINPLMGDEELEDILIVGYDKAFIVLDRRWAELDWLETNITLSHDQLDQLARRLALMGKSTLSVAFPTVMCMIPTHDRVTATYRYEVSPNGTSISIRKFRKEPITIPQLLEQSVMSLQMVAYLWEIIEDKGVIFVVGLPGGGKTTLCNALSLMLKPQFHPVTIEDFPELNLPQENRHSLTARYSKAIRGEGGGKRGEQVGEVSQVDLLRQSLRIRPDFLIVGEILTEEAPVMFQAINTGLGGATSFHATDVHAAVTRLMEKTIGVDPAMLSMIDAVITVKRVKHPLTGEMVRRVPSIDEIKGVNDYNNVFTWTPSIDRFTPTDTRAIAKQSFALQKIKTRRGLTEEQIVGELNEKIHFLEDVSARHLERFSEFSGAIKSFYAAKARTVASKTEPAAGVEEKPTIVELPLKTESVEDRLLKRLQTRERA